MVVIRAIHKYTSFVLPNQVVGSYFLHSLEFRCGPLTCFSQVNTST